MAEIAEATKESMKEKKESMEAEGIRRDEGMTSAGNGEDGDGQCDAMRRKKRRLLSISFFWF